VWVSSKVLSCIILALIAISIGWFSVFWTGRHKTMRHPNEEQWGASEVHFDLHIVMLQPFGVARGFVVSGRA
jgi:hypothetical protein